MGDVRSLNRSFHVANDNSVVTLANTGRQGKVCVY
jgi:hypothetical protein